MNVLKDNEREKAREKGNKETRKKITQNNSTKYLSWGERRKSRKQIGTKTENNRQPH